jgi:hypothetical protein
VSATKKAKAATMLAPCAKCPWLAKFKGPADYLRAGRREEIVRSMLAGAGFSCHETTVPADDDEGAGSMTVTEESKECAGAMLVMARADRSSQPMRILGRLGMLDVDALIERNEGVELWTYAELTEPDEPVETCNTVGPYCEAPAGYMVGGEVVYGTVAAELECPSCGEWVCEACADDEGFCGPCADDEGAE